jgi:hypothetical protein
MTDQNSLQISLAQTLITKRGGNVGHDIFSAILEFIDNSIDASASSIGIGISDDTFYYYENGKGVNDPLRLLGGGATQGKKHAIGKKHTGFNDSLVNLTNCNTNLTIYSCYEGKYSMLRLNMTDMYKSWHEMKHNIECPDIDFTKCQQLLMNGYTPVRDTDMVLTYASKLVDKIPEMKNWLEYSSGIFITMTITNVDTLETIKTQFFDNPKIGEYLNMYYSLHLNILLNNHKQITIWPNNNITKSDIYKPIEYSFYQSDSSLDNIMIKCNDGVVKYISKTDNKTQKFQYKLHDTTSVLIDTYSEIPFTTIEITCISDNDATIQKDILSIRNAIGIEELRGFYIQYNQKMIGLASLPTPKFICKRNCRNIRIKMDISNNEPFNIIDNITMTNKTNLMFDNANPIYLWIFTNVIKEEVLKYLDYTHKTVFEKIDKDPGCVDLPKYIKDKNTPVVKLQLKPEPVPIPVPVATMISFTSGRKKPEPKIQSNKPIISQHITKKPEVKMQSNNLIISNINSQEIIIRRESIHIQNVEKLIRSLIEDPALSLHVNTILTKMSSSFDTI